MVSLIRRLLVIQVQRLISMSWGEVYYDHFSRFFREPVCRKIYSGLSGESQRIQILGYDKVYSQARVFASLGLSHYSEGVGNRAEVVLVSDADYDQVSRVFANALFHLVSKKMQIGWGVAVGGLTSSFPEFSKSHDKEAVYITNCYALPEGIERVSSTSLNGNGFVYWAFLISGSEYRYFKRVGAEQFEDRVQSSGVDPFQLSRSSFV